MGDNATSCPPKDRDAVTVRVIVRLSITSSRPTDSCTTIQKAMHSGNRDQPQTAVRAAVVRWVVSFVCALLRESAASA